MKRHLLGLVLTLALAVVAAACSGPGAIQTSPANTSLVPPSASTPAPMATAASQPTADMLTEERFKELLTVDDLEGILATHVPLSVEFFDRDMLSMDSAQATASTVGYAMSFHAEDGKVFLMAPWNDYAELFDPNIEAFITTGKMVGLTSHCPRGATLLPDGRVFIVGGCDVSPQGDTVAFDSAQVFDPATGRFEAVAGSMSEGRSDPLAVVLPNGQVLVIGGWGHETPLNSAELWIQTKPE